jgi:hypothetical protein
MSDDEEEEEEQQQQPRRPSIRPALLVLMALALASPTLANLLKGSVSAVSAAEHLVGAIVVAWVAVSIVGYTVDSYRSSVLQHEYNQHRRAHH